MSVMSVDVGLKNLAICVMSKQPDASSPVIHFWKVMDILTPISDQGRTCHMCKNQATYKCSGGDGVTEIVYCCKRHCIKGSTTNKILNKKVKDYLLQDIAKYVLFAVENLWESEFKDVCESIDKVLIELQPRVNNKMKFVSHLVYGKIVELFVKSRSALGKKPPVIRFVTASRKLKNWNGPHVPCHLKGDYARRKYLSVKYTEWYISNLLDEQQRDTWSGFYETSKKKDDLADCFLMCYNAL